MKIEALMRRAAAPAAGPRRAADQEMPIFDAHVHYSHDAWESRAAAGHRRHPAQGRTRARPGVELGRRGHARCSPDSAPDLIVPRCGPYRSRGDVSTGRATTVIPFLEERLAKRRYVAIGEFHVYGADADLPECGAWSRWRSSTGSCCMRIRTSTASSAFPPGPRRPRAVGAFGLRAPRRRARHAAQAPNLWCDLAFRSEQGRTARCPPEWREVFIEFPDRFMVGTDTFTPERWHYIVEHARWSRAVAGGPAARRSPSGSPGATARRLFGGPKPQ